MNKRNAFTLIELLVLIAVIAILIGILLPALGRVRKHARTVVCRSNIKQWGRIINLYAQDNEGKLPDHSVGKLVFILRGPYVEDDNRRVTSYAPISTEGITYCPMATAGPLKPDIDPKGNWGLGLASGESWEGKCWMGGTFRAWEFTGLGSPFQCSYGFNGWFSKIGILSGRAETRFHWDILSNKGSSNIPLFLDAAWIEGLPKSNSRPPYHEFYDVCGYSMRCFCINRHNGHVNGLFLDWSVRKIGLKELWTLKWHPEFNTSGEWTKAGGVQTEDWPEWMKQLKDY
jgi:prepilin-type processing-associated H-X9-DG protein